MGLLGKVLCMTACALGVMCTLAAIIEQKDEFQNDYLSSAAKASLGCLVIAFFIFAGALVFLFITLCCACSDICMGTVIAVAGVFGAIFAAVAYGTFHKYDIDSGRKIPAVGEWLFGGLLAGGSVILVAITMAVG